MAGSDMHHALLNAKRRIRNLSRDDPVTGLLNGRAFREVLEHDWAVATREKSTLSLVSFTLDDFDAYQTSYEVACAFCPLHMSRLGVVPDKLIVHW